MTPAKLRPLKGPSRRFKGLTPYSTWYVGLLYLDTPYKHSMMSKMPEFPSNNIDDEYEAQFRKVFIH